MWAGAATDDAAPVAAALERMLTRWGFLRVVDTGTPPPTNFTLRRRIDSGEVPGPTILIASGGIAPAGGSPFYIRPLTLFEARTPGDAATQVAAAARLGADAVKIFTGSYAERDRIVVMPVDVVRGAVIAAHRRGMRVIAHPSNSAGARAAIEGGVDILAHVFPSDADGPWDRTLPPPMVERRMALIPTLALFPWELTPAERFGLAARTGRLATGLEADITVVEGDPAQDVRALARVRYALRGGRLIYGQRP